MMNTGSSAIIMVELATEVNLSEPIHSRKCSASINPENPSRSKSFFLSAKAAPL
ncbi:hypothetical protein D3C71_2252480 [compost metagenome]